MTKVNQVTGKVGLTTLTAQAASKSAQAKAVANDGAQAKKTTTAIPDHPKLAPLKSVKK